MDKQQRYQPTYKAVHSQNGWVQKPPFTQYPVRKVNWIRDGILVGLIIGGIPLVFFLLKALVTIP